MQFKSHTKEKIIEALKRGERVWELNSDADGEDDVLIGEYGEVITDICDHYEVEELPKRWTLIQVTLEDITA